MISESVIQAMGEVLIGLRLSGLHAPYGTVAVGSAEIKIQIHCYVQAICDRVPGKAIDVPLVEKAGAWFRKNNRVFPSAAEFAERYATERSRAYMLIGVDVPGSGPVPSLLLVEVRSDTPPDERRKAIQAALDAAPGQLSAVRASELEDKPATQCRSHCDTVIGIAARALKRME